MKIKRISDTQDLENAFSIRREVFVVEQNVPQDEEYDEYDSTANHYLALIDDTPVGTARWRKTSNGIKLERFAVLKDHRNKGVASELLKKILTDLPSGQEVYLHAQLAAVNLYSHYGFEKVGEKFSECDIEHYKMILNER